MKTPGGENISTQPGINFSKLDNREPIIRRVAPSLFNF